MKHSRGLGCLRAVIAAVILAWLSYALYPWALQQGGYALLRSDPLKKADVIVIMGGMFTVRAREAAALYQEQWSPHILLTREIPPEGFYQLRAQGIVLPETIDMSQKVLEGLGVPGSAIWRIDTPVGSTDEEVRRLGEFLKAQNIQRLIMVTSKSHSRRACLVFDHYYRGDFEIICRYSRFDHFEPKSWWKSRRGVREVVFEWQKLLLYRIQFALDFGRRQRVE